MGLGEFRCPLAARDHRDSLDRGIILFHRPRSRLEEASRTTARRQRRSLASTWRGLLSSTEIQCGAGEDAGGAALVQMGILLDLDLRLRAALHPLLRESRSLPDRPPCAR